MSTTFPAPRDPARDSEHPLARAFASFTEAAGSLERTYGQLQGQVAHLRQELEVTNRDLATSLDENHRIRERLRRILEGLPCGVLVVEAGARISALNPEAARLLGASFESAEALPAALSAALDRARQTGEESELALFLPPPGLDPASSDLEQSSSNQPGSSQVNPAWVAIRHAWLEQGPAHATSVFILRDVSEAKKLEHEREQLRRQQALVEMSALLAHEIRNPLGSLELFAGLLAEANLEGESRRWIEHVQAGLRTLSATVNNVLHLHNTAQPEFAPTDVGQLLDWAYDFLLPLAKQARVEMQIVNGLHGVAIRADRHRLEQVLLNLALNALRFMPGGGWLSIRGTECARREGPEGGGVDIEVRDTGPGIARDDLPRIFDAGYSTRAGSSGLGLAVCRRILEQHGGSIAVESRPGHGATFRLRLPRHATPGTPEATRAGHLPEDSKPEDLQPEDLHPEDSPQHSPGNSSGHSSASAAASGAGL
ncbi:MAG TPA: ATP-binding protein [Candidatus Acidoferrales bacterium]|nr:ATP-binding protein [Candidatus Acidoferrales bacterium]